MHAKVGGETITATTEHPFYVPEKGWTAAIDLRAGDILVMSNGEYVVVEQVQHELLESPIRVYNFEGEDFHTYFGRNHKIVNSNPGYKGSRWSSVDIRNRQGKIVTRRWYGITGKATRDVHFTNHGNPKKHPEVPHQHILRTIGSVLRGWFK